MSILQRIFRRGDRREPFRPLYREIVAIARDPVWYRDGQVPDSVDGRFDMVAAVTALVLLRLEAEGEKAREASALLTELFVADMDASLREIGIGDYVVGKHVGRLMGALGGRLGVLREAEGSSLQLFVERNIFHDSPPSDEARNLVASRLERIRAGLAGQTLDRIFAGEVPRP